MAAVIDPMPATMAGELVLRFICGVAMRKEKLRTIREGLSI